MAADLEYSFSDIATDILHHIPAGAVFKAAITNVFKRRLEASRQILLEEMKKGNQDVFAAGALDEVAAIIYRYGRAAQEGSARINLRLLAQVIAGQHRNGALRADDFLYIADVLSSLKMEEIIMLGVLSKELKECIGGGDKDSVKAAYTARINTENKLIPSVFNSKLDFDATCAALLRTGLLSVVSGFDGLVYMETSLLNRVLSLLSFDTALDEDSELEV